jgi:primosomal protein N' (replication factor Y)
MQPPSICPQCNAGYIKYSGVGTEKIESELARVFPQARIMQLDEQKDIDINCADIFISTQSIVRDASYNFDLIGVLGIDNSLNHVDFRAGEKTFQVLSGLLRLTDKKIIIQTNLAKHHCFQALLSQDADVFYNQELIQRKQLKFPPCQHIGLVKIRGNKEIKVEEIANNLFLQLSEENKDRGINIVSVNRSQPAKLRGNFYWQILTRASSAFKLSRFLKMHLKDVPHSGIIVTVDMDPL